MSDLPEPISDQDLLLHNIAVGTPDISDLEPSSRQEEYLKYIALNGNSGGGGGSSVNVVQGRGTSTTDVMSQNAVSNLTTLGPDASSYADGVAIGNNALSGDTSVSIGKNASANTNGNIAIGTNAKTGASWGVAIGFECKCWAEKSVAIGYSSSIGENSYSVAIGNSSQCSSDACVAIGTQAKATDSQNIAVGPYAQAFGGNSMALGPGAISRNSQGLAIGYNAQTSEGASGAIAIGFSSMATSSNTVSVGNETLTRRIVNVGDPISPQDVATKNYVDTLLSTRSIATLSDETGNISYNLPKVLYQSSEGTQFDITLSDNASNYEYIEVYYHNDLSQYNSAKIDNPNNKYISLGIIGYSNMKIVLQASEIQIKDDTISWINNHIGEQSITQSDIATTQDNYIYIDKVVGYSN